MKKIITKNLKEESLVKKKNILGHWAFLVGVILAVILGLGLGIVQNYQAEILWATFLLGIVIGSLNIGPDEMYSFLTSGTVLALVSFLGIQVGIFDAVAPAIANLLRGILTLFIPATIMAALRLVFAVARK